MGHVRYSGPVRRTKSLAEVLTVPGGFFFQIRGVADPNMRLSGFNGVVAAQYPGVLSVFTALYTSPVAGAHKCLHPDRHGFWKWILSASRRVPLADRQS